MKAFRFAARSLWRQPGRTGLGVLGIAAVGALLFDMLLLSRGLLVSFRDALDRVGFDVRVMATDAIPPVRDRVAHASEIAMELSALPQIDAVAPLLLIDVEVAQAGDKPLRVVVNGVDVSGRSPWTIAQGRSLRASATPELIVNRRLLTVIGKKVGDSLAVRPQCDDQGMAPPQMSFTIVGIADFPFDDQTGLSAATLRTSVGAACGHADDADLILVASREGYGADAAVAAITTRHPELHTATNEQVVRRMQDTGFSYFQQISAVLSSITILFGFLLITVLLTVSVNQRLAEVAAMRALGFSRGRMARDVLWQSALLVGTGGLLAVPLGFILSQWLDRILKTMPGIPLTMHFFVFEPRALALHGALMVVTAFLAALYPMWLVASLPIATTLRNEVVS